MSATAQSTDSKRFRVLVTSAGFEPGFRGGGPIRSVARVVDTVSDMTELRVVTKDRDLGSHRAYPGRSGHWVNHNRTPVFYLNVWSPNQWFRLWRQLRSMQFDLLYVNSFWSPVFTVIPIVAMKLGLLDVTRVLIAPRGELSRGALTLKSLKKNLFLKWWAPLLQSVDVRWHASSDEEADEIKAIFASAQVVIIRPQVALPEEAIQPSGPTPGPTRFVFISRISPKKNLDLALVALQAVSEPVTFDIYGPIGDSRYWSQCERLIRQLPSNVAARYRGTLEPAAVRDTFACYDAFVFPTRGESFGHVIAESLSASCPVLCSDQTPWTAVIQSGGGSVVRNLTAGNLALELRRFAARPPTMRFDAKQAAGKAYSAWRASSDANILDSIRELERAPIV